VGVVRLFCTGFFQCVQQIPVFYAVPIIETADNSVSKGFVEIVKIGTAPDKEHLWRSLFKQAPCGNITWK
jgi:hypothetical protein